MPPGPAMMAASAMPRNSPFSTTPAPASGLHRAPRDPRCVRRRSRRSNCRRRSQAVAHPCLGATRCRPRSRLPRQAPQPYGASRSGRRTPPPRAKETCPSLSTRLEASAITTIRSDAVATIFSRSKAPPPPLISLRSSSSSSAPSTVRSRNGVLSSVLSFKPRRSARIRVASEVGTHRSWRPVSLTRWPTRSTNFAAVEPVPRPNRMPSLRRLSACAAACCLKASD